jgi:hypothetical protein
MNESDRFHRYEGIRLRSLGHSPGRKTTGRTRLLLILLHFAVLAGCSRTVMDSSGPASGAAPNQRVQADEIPERPENGIVSGSKTDESKALEFWAACFVRGEQVGFTHLVIEPMEAGGRGHHRYRYQDKLKMRRFQDTTVVRSMLECVEDSSGGVVSFRSQVETGPSAMVTEGVFEHGQLRMELQTAGRTEQRAIAWDARWGGFFADHRSLRQSPMKPRETRRIQALLPILHQAGEIHLEAVGYESVPLLEETRQLLRIDMTTVVGGTKLRSIVWSDERGEVWKTRDLQLDLETFRCDRDTALRPLHGEGFDLGSSTVVPLAKPLPDAHRSRQAVYRARLAEGEIAQVFVQDGSQSVRAIDPRNIELTVQSIRPDRPDSFPESAWTEPTPADREPTAMIQSDDSRIVEMASQVAPQETDAWRLACELERFVKRTVQLKNYSTAMATAAEVAETLEGDCTEHAMLLAALCRARQIPARVAIGLVYHAPVQGFAYHMWTEVWIADRWIGLDATLGHGGIGAAHLKLAVSSMDGSSAFADMLPIVQVIGRLELHVLSTEP